MYYSCETYDNYAELVEALGKFDIPQRLLADVGEGEWQNHELYVYSTISDFALYELKDGWYCDCGLGNRDYNGAPDPLEYIDLDGLGEALLATGDPSMVWYDDNMGVVVTTSFGW